MIISRPNYAYHVAMYTRVQLVMCLCVYKYIAIYCWYVYGDIE